MDSSEFVEKYAILMLGVKEVPIPSILHLQKEFFILSKIKPEIDEHFNFKAHYKGPFSQVLNSVIEDSVYIREAFDIQNNRILLGHGGLEELNKLLEENKSEQGLKDIMLQMKFIREFYEKLTEDELLFLIYDTYKEFPDRSLVSERILGNKYLRNKIIEGLFSKSLITEGRYDELKERYE
jgi:hypothetical protein